MKTLFDNVFGSLVTMSVIFVVGNTAFASSCPPQWTTPPPPCEMCPCPPGTNSAGSDDGGGDGNCHGCGGIGDGRVTSLQSSSGMPIWRPWEAQADYRLFDTPLKYASAYGPPISLDLVYQNWRSTDYDYYPRNDANPLFGRGWNCSWSSDVVVDGRVYWNYLGGRIVYSFSSDPLLSDVAHDGSRFEILQDGSSNVIGAKIRRTDGSVLEYLQAYSSTKFLLSKITDANGHSLTFNYDGYGRLEEITDATGETASLFYADLDGDSDESNNRVVTQVSAPGGRVASFEYDFLDAGAYDNTGWYLTNIIDTVGIQSAFTYRLLPGGWINDDWALDSMTTPYGTTQFEYLPSPDDFYGPALLISEPDGRQHLYLHADYSARPAPVPEFFNPSVIPDGLPIGTLDTNRYYDRNTFYWGPVQLSAIGNLDLSTWDWNQFKLARIRHWLYFADPWDGGHHHVSDTLSWEQAPSPDGSNEGQVTWYDYVGKDPYNVHMIGTGTQLPAVIARVMPDGTTWYQYFERNFLGKPTNVIEKWESGGNPLFRTNTYLYAANGVDLLAHTNALGVLVSSNIYNAFHQVVTNYDALGQMTTYTYDLTTRQLTSITRPSGLITTNIYDVNGRLQETSDLPIGRTRTYTWYNDGNIESVTDERGLTVTNFWDSLDRLTGKKFPDGTTTTNLYTRGATMLLDLTATKDRMDHWTYFDYDGLRRKVAETNANGVITRYGYCECGGIASVTNAWSTSIQQTTTMHYDYQGNLTRIAYADGYSVTNWYNALGKRIATGDGWGQNWFGYDYDNLGLLTSVTNALGMEEKRIVYDLEDRPVFVTDANGVTITNNYDDLGRLISRTYPDGGAEHFGYSARGMTAYTNQLNLVTTYAYDEAGRKTFETNANLEVIRYTNSPAGDLFSLTDGKNQTTRWNYDEYGRVTNKIDQADVEILRYRYDADGHLTNRWSAAKGDTYYSYDAMGNLTNVVYANSPNLSFAYDALNRLTNMVDASGTSRFTYTAGNQLLTEDGPFSSDVITNTYQNRLRVSLHLQQPLSGLWTNTFFYDAAKRLTNVISPAGTFAYEYISGASRLPGRINLPNGAYITNSYAPVARLLSTTLNNSSHAVLNSHGYEYNTGNQRTQQVFSSGSTVDYTYDSIGQLVHADSATASEDRGYFYDAAWNLNRRTNNAATQLFSVDSKNQLVTDPDWYAANYDENGNLTNRYMGGWELPDWKYEYDDENQLISVTHREDGETPISRAEFVYDGKGRLRQKIDYAWEWVDGGWNWGEALRTKYIYDGMRVIQERIFDTPRTSYTRGNDLSGTLEGAGGIGGLLARTSHSGLFNPTLTHAYYHADGNGNITYLVDGSQNMAASYRYDPFGNIISQSGSLATTNVYRFSSKEFHANSGMYYYGYRWYVPGLQRWVNRDPLGDEFVLKRVQRNKPVEERDALREETLRNLFVFVYNDAVNWIDPEGLRRGVPPGFFRPKPAPPKNPLPGVPGNPPPTKPPGWGCDEDTAYKKIMDSCRRGEKPDYDHCDTVCLVLTQGLTAASHLHCIDLCQRCGK